MSNSFSKVSMTSINLVEFILRSSRMFVLVLTFASVFSLCICGVKIFTICFRVSFSVMFVFYGLVVEMVKHFRICGKRVMSSYC